MSKHPELGCETAALVSKNKHGQINIRYYSSVRNAKLAVQHLGRGVQYEIIKGTVHWDLSNSSLLSTPPQVNIGDALGGGVVVDTDRRDGVWWYTIDTGSGSTYELPEII